MNRAVFHRLGLSVGIAIAATFAVPSQVEARGMYCSRHPTSCAERRQREAEQREYWQRQYDDWYAKLTPTAKSAEDHRQILLSMEWQRIDTAHDNEMKAIDRSYQRSRAMTRKIVLSLLAMAIAGFAMALFASLPKTGSAR